MRPLLTHRRLPRLFQGRLRKFANLCFSGAFSPRKHGVRGNECQKRSVVSVWYAQNSLPLCTEVWYTTLTGCEDPTKMLIRVCILLQMQPAPLTGTATQIIRGTNQQRRDAARAPHGDSNAYKHFCVFITKIDAARTPHGDSNIRAIRKVQGIQRCSPHPSRGQQRVG